MIPVYITVWTGEVWMWKGKGCDKQSKVNIPDPRY